MFEPTSLSQVIKGRFSESLDQLLLRLLSRWLNDLALGCDLASILLAFLGALAICSRRIILSWSDDNATSLVLLSGSPGGVFAGLRNLELDAIRHSLRSSLRLSILCVILIVIIVIMEFSNSPVGAAVGSTSTGVSFLIFHTGCSALRGLSCSRGRLTILGRGRMHAWSTCSRLSLNTFLSFSSLLLLQFFVLVHIDLFRTFFCSCACHLLSHHLLKWAIFTTNSFTVLENSFWSFVLSLNLGFSELFNIGFWQYTCFMRLPFNIVKLLKSLRLF